MSLYVGIDVGKFHHVACFLDKGENQIELLKFGNSHQGFSELEKLIKGFSTPEMNSFWEWRQLAITGSPSTSF